MPDERSIVLDMLLETERGRLGSAVTDAAFKKYKPAKEERVFITRLYHGVLERKIWLDFLIKYFSSVKFEKIRSVILNILRMGIYQLVFMDSVPDRAAIFEAVRLAQERGFSGLAPYVNALLRSAQRLAQSCGERPENAGADKTESISENGIVKRIEEGLDMPKNIRLCVPKWLYEKIENEYGEQTAGSILNAALYRPHEITVRFNLLKKSVSEILRDLKRECKNIRRLKSPYRNLVCCKISGFVSIPELSAYKEGFVTVQDYSAALAAFEAASFSDNPKLIVDVCAAPGGKSMCMAELLPKANVLSFDIGFGKIKKIKENAARMGYENISACEKDALLPVSEGTRADIVIADLPCSGLGTMAGKPDLRWRVKEKDIYSLQEKQRQILKNAVGYLSPGGILLYSTCTITKEENSDNTAWLLENFNLELLKEKQILPSADMDGFYYAVLRYNA